MNGHDPIIFLSVIRHPSSVIRHPSSVIRVLAVKFPLTVKDETTLGSEETDTKGDAKV
ncbi:MULTISPECIES: hypothetical protein [Yersinia pseudotuberculosis complex]|uniref:hypothetical protein n=1 Tax=Yersinia pseudotuberculosis complex TaxID=1649845 RepID=UPI000169A980|nr:MULTISPECIES: hypothetical protein [Yersinia pseudotuberculosis complex]